MDPYQLHKLTFLHTETSLVRLKLERFSILTNDQLIQSLAPGTPSSLKVRPDGTILDGHHRIRILSDRGVDVHHLPREIIERDDEP